MQTVSNARRVSQKADMIGYRHGIQSWFRRNRRLGIKRYIRRTRGPISY